MRCEKSYAERSVGGSIDILTTLDRIVLV